MGSALQGGFGPSERRLGSSRNEDTKGDIVASAADVASDLDGVLRQLRKGVASEQRGRSPSKLTPRK